MTRSRAFWRILEIASFAIAAASFVVAVGLGQQFIYTAPLSPQPAAGKIYEFEAKGKVVYITKGEWLMINSSFIIAWAGFLISGLIEVRKHPFSKHGN